MRAPRADAAVTDHVFASFVSRYLAAIATIEYPDLAQLQGPPLASLASGGAGTAYGLWRARRDRPAAAWARAALADRRQGAFEFAGARPIDRRAYMFGWHPGNEGQVAHRAGLTLHRSWR